MNLSTTNPGEFAFQKFGSHNLVCCATGDQHCIALTNEMVSHVVKWCHLPVTHAKDVVQLEASLQSHFWHACLCNKICQQLHAGKTCVEVKNGVPMCGALHLASLGLKLMSISLVHGCWRVLQPIQRNKKELLVSKGGLQMD